MAVSRHCTSSHVARPTDPIVDQSTTIASLVIVRNTVRLGFCGCEKQTLHEDENGRADDRDEVQGKVHDVSDQCLWAEALKGTLENLSQPLHGLRARLNLAAFADHVCRVSGDKGAVKGVEDGILKYPVSGDDVDNGRALIENQEDGSDDGEGPVDEDEDGELRQIGKGKHSADDGRGEGEVGPKAGEEGLPKGTVGEEVEDTLR